MPGPKPNKLHDDLDALLDGRPVELTDELVPLVEAADALWVELATYELDPEIADRHLARVLEDSAPVVALPARGPARPGHLPAEAGHRAAPPGLGAVVPGPRGRPAHPDRRRAPGGARPAR